MIIDYTDPSEVLLQISAQNPDGSPKSTLSLAKIRVYHINSGSENVDLIQQDLSYVTVSKVWRYIWEPTSLTVGHYVIEYKLTDDDAITAYFLEDIVIQEQAPTVEEIDAELTENHGDGNWQTSPDAGSPVIIPGNGD